MAIVICNRPSSTFVRAIRHTAAWTVLVALLWLVTGPASAQSDADFLAAKDAFERGDRAKLDMLAMSELRAMPANEPALASANPR